MKGLALLMAFPLLAAPALAEDAARIEALERRIEQLEQRAELAEERARVAEERSGVTPSEGPSAALSGSANFGWFGGQADSVTHQVGASVQDARLFVDAELGEELTAGSLTLVRNLGFTFEWDLVRLGKLRNDIGELYVDLQGLGGSSWLNLRPGRFQIPVGESYKRYSRGYAGNPFISNPVGGPWFWDEGVMLYGQSDGGSFGYVTSLTNGETPFADDDGDGEQLTLKLWTQLAPWLYASFSGLRTGEIGSGGGALWLGETWAFPIGSMTAVPTSYENTVLPDTSEPFDSSWLAGADLVLTPRDDVRLWLGGGHYTLDSRADSDYDRTLRYWIAELLLQGSLLRPELSPAYFGLRADGVSTGDDELGYLLDVRYGDTLGFNMRSLSAYSAVVGWRLGGATTLRAEYSLRDIELIEGVPSSVQSDARDADTFGIEVGVRF